MEAVSSNFERERYSPEVKVSGGRASLISLMVKVRTASLKTTTSVIPLVDKNYSALQRYDENGDKLALSHKHSARIPTCHKSLVSKVTER